MTDLEANGRSRGHGCLGTIVSVVIFCAVLAAAVYTFPDLRTRFVERYRNAVAEYFPCRQPETYAIGAFDERFKISRDEFAAAIAEAEGVWEAAAGRELFAPVESTKDAALIINLNYDSRQQATDTLRNLGVKIDNDKAGYDRLKAEHDALVARYETAKASFEAAVAAHDRRVDAYEAEVQRWNRRGGAPAGEYERLQSEARAIDTAAHRLNDQRDELNAMVDQINAGVSVLNRMAAAVNEVADKYNDVSSERGAEFEEGLFTGVVGSGRIDIFEFDDQDRLVRLLMHEMGHALGMEHVDDEKAVMYRLNTSSSQVLTEADKAELQRVCIR